MLHLNLQELSNASPPLAVHHTPIYSQSSGPTCHPCIPVPCPVFPLLFTPMATALSKPHGRRALHCSYWPSRLSLPTFHVSLLQSVPTPLKLPFPSKYGHLPPGHDSMSTRAVHRVRSMGVTGVNNSNRHSLDKHIWKMMDLNKTRQVSLLTPGILQCANTEMEIVFSFAKFIDRRSFPHISQGKLSSTETCWIITNGLMVNWNQVGIWLKLNRKELQVTSLTYLRLYLFLCRWD